jgi:hypothetical protein
MAYLKERIGRRLPLDPAHVVGRGTRRLEG